MKTTRTLLGVSLAAPTTASALAEMQRLAALADIIELRLDLMAEFDLPRLLRQRPCPVVVTYRSQREGGRFDGREAERIETLRQAAALGAEVIDIEWDSFDRLGDIAPARRMISRHFWQALPPDFQALHGQMAASGAEIVKIAALARRQLDVIPVLETLQAAAVPTVAIAMGPYGVLSRILAPLLGAWLTYAAPGQGQAVAPGQIAIETLHQRYQALRGQRMAQLPVRGFWAADANDPPPLDTAQGAGALWVPCLCAPDEDKDQVRQALQPWVTV